MARLIWSDEVGRIFPTLPTAVRIDILSKAQHLTEFPEMYPLRRRGRFRGHRFFVSFQWLVYYTVQAEQTVIVTIGHARRRSA